MKTLILALLTLSLSACSLMDEIPSFYDDNESKAIIDLVHSIESLDCSSDSVKQQVETINDDLQWLMTYTELKGTNDVYSVLMIVDSTMATLIKNETISQPYCEIKRKNLLLQTNSAAKAIFRRFK